MLRIALLALLSVFVVNTSVAQIDLEYQKPPKEILNLVDIQPTPSAWINGDATHMLLMSRNSFKSLEEVAAEEWRLAGLRINPKTNGGSRTRFYTGAAVKHVKSGKESAVAGMPANAQLANASWSPDYSKLAFTNTTQEGIALWVLDVEKAQATRLSEPTLNDVFWGNPYEWLPDGSGLLCRMRTNVGKELNREQVLPKGPTISENKGQRAPARTYQDLLKNKADEAYFDYFAESSLVLVNLDGTTKAVKGAGVYSGVEISPDGNYILVNQIVKPYSYLVPYYRFPTKVEVIDFEGKSVQVVAETGLIEEMPKGFDAVRKGPRSIGWRNDKGAVLYWAEALDGGDPQAEAEHRDAVYQMKVGSTQKQEMARLKLRFNGVTWGDDQLAIFYDGWWRTRKSNVYMVNPSAATANAELVYEVDREDYYNRPGSFLTDRNQYGQRVLLKSKDGKYLYQESEGYTPDGNKPYVARFDIASKTNKVLWQAAGKSTYEQIIKVVDIDKGDIITRIESKEQNPNYYWRNIKKGKSPKAITSFPHPYESIKGISKETIHYKRKDGVDLSAVLYLPAGYDKEKDGRLPMLMWAYPREFKNAKKAGQVKESPHKFTRLYYGSPIYWVARGYAVLDRADFPIIGEGETEPNDSFVEQLVMNAEAAINTVDEMGVVDPERVGVGGHSYGAFMTANLLAHSDLFAAGIARSGAYNRTLTPFGFQAEERTFWEAKDVYMTMSPFMHADKVNEPILLIHGAADNNSGTFPMQSERFYNALKGHGAVARLVMLPHESHGYAAKASIMHMLWEMDMWLETHVKNRKKSE